eukprot:COSAG02_NODE_2612_length_8419_cov_2.286779_3_plen_303_part_00
MHHMRTYPYLVHKHNTIDAIGHCILILTYTVTFVLRGDLENEIFPREGYGIFIVLLYIIVLPAPTVYYFLKEDSMEDERSPTEDFDFDENPLSVGGLDDDDEAVADSDNASGSPAVQVLGQRGTGHAPPRGLSTAKLAKIIRENKELRAENSQQKVVIQTMEAEATALRNDNTRNGAAFSAVQDAVTTSSPASLSAEANTMQLLATATADAAAAMEKQKQAESRMWDTRRPSQIVAMKSLVQEGVLSEESMVKAQQALEGHVSNQVLTRQLQEKHERDKLAAQENKLALLRMKSERKTYREQ